MENEFLETRLQVHWAAQALAAVATRRLPVRGDDSQSNLGYSASLPGLVTHEFGDGSRLGIRLTETALVRLARSGEVTEMVPVNGHTLDELLEWADRDTPDAPQPAGLRDYDMPDHAVSRGEPFALADGDASRTLASLCELADRQINRAARPHANGGEARLWPHHFDFGCLVFPNKHTDPATDPCLGVGMSLGDSTYDAPYAYVNPYGLGDEDPELPALSSGGFWAEDWTGAILLIEPTARNETEVREFLDSAIESCLSLIR